MVSTTKDVRDVKVLVGLGNPGAVYRETRHNAGFLVVDRLAKMWDVSMVKDAACQSLVGKARQGNQTVLLVKPATFMNRSGLAVARILHKHSALPADVTVVLDDVSIPLGMVRVRAKGGAAGHNGLVSVIESLGTREFSRVRLGIQSGLVESKDLAEFVLGEFGPGEKEKIADAIERAAQALEMLVRDGLGRAMSSFNRR